MKILTFLLAFLLSGCAMAGTPWPTETPSPVPPTQIPTVTMVWFPPTATFTPFPTALPPSPTEDMRPGVGEVLLQDQFQASSAWKLAPKEGGSVAFGKDELSIAISAKRVYVYGLRTQPILVDFYAEITANPSLCRGQDEYGLLVRAVSNESYYRFSLSCDGQVRLDRVLNGQASSPQPWMFGGMVPVGGPSRSRLGVWAVGPEMRFFVNGEYQFSVRDDQIPAGGLGVFARSASDEALTVNFSDLVVREVTR